MFLNKDNSPPRSWNSNKEEFTEKWTPEGYTFAVYDSNEADAWIDMNDDCELCVSLQKEDIGGPVACMISCQTAVLAVFGIISPNLITAANQLADLSGFPVIIRPRDEDPHRYCKYVV